MADAKQQAEKPNDEIEAYFAAAKRDEPYRDKSVALAYVWLFFFWPVLAHRLYVKRWRSAVAILAVAHTPGVLLLITFLAGVPILPDSVITSGYYLYLIYAGGGLIVSIVLLDIFLIPSMVRAHNQLAREMRDYLGLR